MTHGRPEILAGPISLERIVPDELELQTGATGSETLQLHLDRYRFAARHAPPGRLLDIACGVGYGSYLVAGQCPEVKEIIGVDLSTKAIDYASRRYGSERVRFIQHDAMTFADPAGFDTIISLETLEHLPDPHRLVTSLADKLNPLGVMICSVPVTPSVDANPHHLHDFTPSSFRRMFDGLGLKTIDQLQQVQPNSVGKVVTRTEQRMADMRPNLLGYYCRHPLSGLKRIGSVLLDGFNNKYLTLALQKTS
jgi:cyclopropane fatty-acyl-phospholipid synthase-like methyltransferase